MATHTHIGDDTLETCLDALDILIENDTETLESFLGHDWDLEHLYKVMAAGPCADLSQDDLDYIQTYLDRFNASVDIKAVLNVV